MPATRKPDDYYYDADSYWCEESKRLAAAVDAEPTHRQHRLDLAHAEKQREFYHDRAAAKWERECEVEYAAQWASWAYGPDVNGAGPRAEGASWP